MSNKEMKMSDYFKLPLQGAISAINHDMTIEFNNDGVAPFDAAEHAINTHDKLVSDLAAMEERNAKQISVLNYLIGEYDPEEIAHHCGVDGDTALDIFKLLGDNNE